MRLRFMPLLMLLAGPAQAQQLSEIPQGLRDETPRWHALTGARLVLAPGQVVDNGTLVMKDGVIVAVGADVRPPAGARVWALQGRTVYAGFVDAASSLGQARIELAKAKGLTGVSPAMMEGFAAAKVLVEGLRRAGPKPTRQKLRDALEGMKRVDIGGLEVTYSPADHSGLDFADLSIVGENGRFLR